MEKRKPITSDRSISSHKAEAKEYLVPVKGRPKLYLMVRPNETKSWLFRYTSPNTGKSQRISFGIYPSITLARAHDIWQEYQDLLSKNIDPNDNRKAVKQALLRSNDNTFGHFADEYFETLKSTLKPNTLQRKLNCLKLLKDSFAETPIDGITPPQMLSMLIDVQNQFVKADGKPTEKAERCASIASDIFKYASARGFCSTDPANMVKSQLIKPVYGHRPAIIQPDKFAKLLQDIESLATKVDGNTISSLRLLSVLFVRNGDLRRMRWADLDFKEAKWRFQPLKGESKEHMVRDMVVPLPHQAITILQNQFKINGHQEYVFYSPSAKKNGIISDNTANKHLKELGYQNVHCVHGFRASAKTMLQEQLKYPAVIVEMGLGHITKDQNGTAYGRFEFLEDRAEMMKTWADYLDGLRNDEDVSRFKNRTSLNSSKGMPEEIMKQLIKQLGKDKILELIK